MRIDKPLYETTKPDKFDEFKLKGFMFKWKIESKIPKGSNIIFFTRYNKHNDFVLEVYTEYPGYLIGKNGSSVQSFANKVKDIGIDKVYITEVKSNNTV